jgi:hypothetical protein
MKDLVAILMMEAMVYVLEIQVAAVRGWIDNSRKEHPLLELWDLRALQVCLSLIAIASLTFQKTLSLQHSSETLK